MTPPASPLRRVRRIAPLVLAAFVLFVTACSDGGDDDSGSTTTTAPPTTTAAATETVEGGDGQTEPTVDEPSEGDPDEADGTTTRATSTPVEDNLPGEPFFIGPARGEAMDVVGVRYNDVLNLRALPDPGADIVTTAAPLSAAPTLVSSGEGRLLTSAAWWEITADGEPVWANATFLGSLGPAGDVTDELPALEASSLSDLAEAVGATRGDGPEPLVVFATEPVAIDGNGGEATIDVIGLGDDAVKGERIDIRYDFIYDNPDADNREVVGYRLTSATATAICGRGVSSDGRCN